MTVHTSIGRHKIKAASPIPPRCERGQMIHIKWSRAVNKASMSEWEHTFGKGYVPYMKHMKKCSVCREHEIAYRNRSN